MNIWGRCLKWFGWKVSITAPRRDKCIICVAPHTSNLDFLLGLAAYRSLGREANFLMKEFWFFFPLKYLLRAFGGIPVPKKHGGNLTSYLVDRMKSASYMNLAVTPEGTRSPVEKWRTGFLRIAWEAKVPVQLGVIDYGRKEIIIAEEFHPTGDIEKDLAAVRAYYRQFPDAAKYPAKYIP